MCKRTEVLQPPYMINVFSDTMQLLLESLHPNHHVQQRTAIHLWFAQNLIFGNSGIRKSCCCKFHMKVICGFCANAIGDEVIKPTVFPALYQTT